MALLPSASDLPYHLPTDTKGQLLELAKTLRISPQLVENSGDQGLEAMCATILYRHMSQRQRMAAMTAIKSIPNRQLQSKLVAAALDTTFVNPQWGLWSLTNEEIAEDEAFHDAVDTFGSILGVTFSVSSGKDVAKEFLEKRKLTKGGLAMMVIWVAFAGNRSSLNAVREEKERRAQIKESS